MDLESRRRWSSTNPKEIMLERTHIPEARWFVVQQVRQAEVQHPEIHLPLR